MTVSVQTPTSSQAANGVTTDFPFAYKVRSASDLVVTLADASGNETTQTLGVHYTVSGTGTSSGTVTFLAAPASGMAVRTRRVTALSRSTDYQDNGDLLAAVLNGDVDAVWLALQELVVGAQIAGNVLRAPIGETLNPIGAAAVRAAKFLGFDASGNPVPLSGTGNDVALRTDLAGLSGSALVAFLQSGVAAASRTMQAKMRDWMCAQDFGVTGDGTTNDTAKINNALAAAYLAGKKLYFPAGTYRYAEASSGIGYALLNRGVSMIGEGRMQTIFAPLSTMPNTADFMLINPLANADISQLELADFFVYPDFDGTVRGRKGIYLKADAVSNLSKLHVHGLLIHPCRDFAFEVLNTIAANPQGVPAYSCFEKNIFFDGVKGVGIGDSNVFRDNFHNTPAASARPGLYLYHVDGTGGVSSHSMIYGNAMDCDGGAIILVRARNPKIFWNNIEQSHGNGSNGAVIDIDGSGGAIPVPEVKGNHIGVFGTASLTSVIRINGANGAEVEGNTLLPAVAVTNGIVITSSAANTVIGRNGIDSTHLTNNVSDSGTSTCGVANTLTLAVGSPTGAGYQSPQYYRTKENVVTVKGTLSGTIASGSTIATLPAGFRPAAVERFSVSATIGGSATTAAIEIDSAGAVKYISGAGSATFLSLGGISFTTTPIFANTL